MLSTARLSRTNTLSHLFSMIDPSVVRVLRGVAAYPASEDDVKEGLRPPKWSKKGKYPGVGGVSVLGLQYGDFRAALTFGLSLSLVRFDALHCIACMCAPERNVG